MSKIIEQNLIGERLAYAVKLLGFVSYPEFIKASGINKVTFYTILKENRKPNTNTSKKLYDIGINVNYVVDGIGGPLLPRGDEENYRMDFLQLQQQKRQMTDIEAKQYASELDQKLNDSTHKITDAGTEYAKSDRKVGANVGENFYHEITIELKKAIKAWDMAMEQLGQGTVNAEVVTDLRTQLLIMFIKMMPNLEPSDLKLVRELIMGEIAKKSIEQKEK